MFIGHFAAGLGGKSLAPRASLGTLFFAAQFLDLLWPVTLLLGLEHVRIAPGITAVTPLDFVSYPITHSLLTVLGWGAVFGIIYWLLRRKARTAVVLGLLVVSHWVLDLIVHRPDLPLFPWNSPVVGLGLWHSYAATLLVEGLLFVVGITLYLRVTRAKNRVGRHALWTLGLVLVVVYLMSIFGPPPPSTEAIGWAGLLQWLFVGWAYWVDRNRDVHVGL